MPYSVFSDINTPDPREDLFLPGKALEKDTGKQVGFFEAATNDDEVAGFSKKQAKASAMAAALTWVDEGDFSFASLDVLVVGLSDADEDGEITDEEEDVYNDILQETASALVALGGEAKNVEDFINNEDDKAGAKLGSRLASALDDIDTDDDEIVSRFATGGAVFECAVFEAVEKVIKGGEVKYVKKRMKKRRMTAKQRAALKKARRKSNTSAARRNRAKSMKVREQRGF